MKTKLFSFLGLISFTLIFSQDIVSTFDANDEGWLVVGDATSSVPDWHSTGGNPGGYISADDTAAGGVWFWEAPSKFRGNQSQSFGKNLKFHLTQNNFSNPFEDRDVVIEGNNKTIIVILEPNPLATWTHYTVKLDISANWKINDYGGNLATNDDIQEVLSNITSLKIRGEYESGPDTGGLDNVILESNSLSVNDIQNKKFQIYPNPASSVINLSQNLYEIKILNSVGQMIKSVDKTDKIDVSKFSIGIYILNGVTASGEKVTSKFIKN